MSDATTPDTAHPSPDTPNRPSLPTSSSAFALPPSTSTPPKSPNLDEGGILSLRFRRPSLLAPKASYSSNSPLISSHTTIWRRRRRRTGTGDESESDKERMMTDSSPSSSENPTPPLRLRSDEPSGNGSNGGRGPSPLPTPPSATEDKEKALSRSFRSAKAIKPLRILSLREEERPEDAEVKSEAAFQRFLSSGAENPSHPRTPRSTQDRGRYPEEAVHEDTQRDPTTSDDEDEDEEEDKSFPPSLSSNESIKPLTSIYGDDFPIPESPGFSMDIDMPLYSPGLPPSSSYWRYTPPPTSNAPRTNKRKHDDRYEPYPSSSKRRAVSPSLSQLRDSHPSIIAPLLNPRPGSASSNNTSTTRLPISIPISIPNSAPSSVASSPTISSSFPTPGGNGSSRPMQLYTNLSCSSPILRPVVKGLSSPVLRPAISRKKLEGEEKEVEGAGEAVGGLTIRQR